MEQAVVYEGTPQQLAAWLRHRHDDKRYRIVEVEESQAVVQEKTDEAEARPYCDANETTRRPSVLGKYAFVAGGSEEFAREKQAEIEREDRPR